MSKLDKKRWGHLAERFSTPGPRKMLALDGGGIRGLITARMLVRLEEVLASTATGKKRDFRLCDYFDYIGGTSTGAIMAAALARGMSAKELLKFYKEFGTKVFTKRSIFSRWKSLYDDGDLEKKLKEVFGSNTRLYPNDLRTLLLVVTRNHTTDSAWPVSSNPDAMFNDRSSSTCNLDIPLYQLVRASTAAPVYFPPEVVRVDHKKKEDYVFVDGGTTPYNCPAFLMYRMATEPAYRLNWQPGEKNLLMVSLGTGGAPVLGNDATDPESNIGASVLNTLSAVMEQTQVDQDMNCRTIGRCSHGSVLNMEVGDLIPREKGRRVPLSRDLGRQFLYLRFNAELSSRGLKSLGLQDVDPEKVNKLDSTEGIPDLLRIGEKLTEQINPRDFGSFI